jgi:hypothetical protein
MLRLLGQRAYEAIKKDLQLLQLFSLCAYG